MGNHFDWLPTCLPKHVVHSLLASGDFCYLQITFINSLNPYPTDRMSKNFLKTFILKKSIKSPACKELLTLL